MIKSFFCKVNDPSFIQRHQAQRRMEFIPSGGANNRECSTLFKRRAGLRNQASSPQAEERRARREDKSETDLYRDQSSKMGHKQLQIARKVLKPYTKCVGRQGASTGYHACKQKPRHILGYDQ